MPTCELSGKDVPKTIRVRIEGTVMQVAPEHASLGEVMDTQDKKFIPRKSNFKPKKRFTRPSIDDGKILVDDYAKKVSQARQKTGMKQDEFAKSIKEKASVIQHVETGHIHPSDALVKKLERALNITLMTTVSSDDDDEDEQEMTADVGKAQTLGDMLMDALKKKK